MQDKYGDRDDLQPSVFTKPWQWEEDGCTVTRTTVWTAPGCHEGCGVLIYSKDGKVVGLEGDPENPYNHGRLCPRCFTITDVMYHPDRIVHPMKRDRSKRGQADAWEQCSWDEALQICYDEFTKISQKYGPETIHMIRGTGRDAMWQLGRLGYAIGTPNEYGCMSANSCYLPRLSQMIMTVGGELLPDFGEWLALAQDDPEYVTPNCCIVWGCDPLISNPDNKMGMWLTDCMKKGTKVISVDPRVTWIASRAAIRLQLRPGTDGALAMAMVNTVITEDLYDHDFVDKWCYGFDELKERVAPMTAEKVAEICWIDADKIRAAARLFAEAKPANVFWGVSVDMQKSGTGAAQGIEALFIITGNIDIPGGMCFMREPFGLIQGAGGWGAEFLDPEVAEKRLGIQEYPMYRFGLPHSQPDVAYESGRAGNTHGLWVQASNPLSGMADEVDGWYEIFANTDFCAGVDLFMTPTLQFGADVFLPVSCFPEKISCRPYFDLCTLNQAVEPYGEAKSDAEINRLLGRMFREEVWPWESEEELYDDILSPSGFTYQQLREVGPIYPKYEYRKHEKGMLRADGQPGFETPTGRIELFSTLFNDFGVDPMPNFAEPALGPIASPDLYEEYPIILMTGSRDPVFFHTEHRQIEHLRQFSTDPFVEFNPKTAQEMNLNTGDWVWLENPRGRCRQRVRVTHAVREGMALARHGWWYPEKDGNEPTLYGTREVNVNYLLKNAPSPTGFGADIKCVLCKVYKCTDEEVR